MSCRCFPTLTWLRHKFLHVVFDFMLSLGAEPGQTMNKSYLFLLLSFLIEAQVGMYKRKFKKIILYWQHLFKHTYFRTDCQFKSVIKQQLR